MASQKLIFGGRVLLACGTPLSILLGCSLVLGGILYDLHSNRPRVMAEHHRTQWMLHQLGAPYPPQGIVLP